MCGITGFIHFKDQLRGETILSAMTDAIAHRGPDDHGLWLDSTQKCGLGHRRLSILDLSPLGHQPMHSASNRFVIVYNGEIYNHDEIRQNLMQKGVTFKGHSDTEVLLASIETYGLFHTLPMLNGMFAFALYDQKDKIITLVRDRLGVKPLYFSLHDGGLVFGSELKALMVHPLMSKTINQNALSAYFSYGFIPDPMTIYQGVSKLDAGTILQISLTGQVRKQKFWDLKAVAQKALSAREKQTFSPKEIFDHTHALLQDAVQMRMVSSDVPVGSFLSGGIDSSLITALMQAQNAQKVQTFSIGFANKSHDESAAAKAIARQLQTTHHSFEMGGADALRMAEKMASTYDEPFADSSALATLFLSEQTSKHVTVALSGDGGDELFQGYHRHIWAEKLKRQWFNKSAFSKKTTAGMLNFAAKGGLETLGNLLPTRYRPVHLAEKLMKLARVIGLTDPYAIYDALLKTNQGYNLHKNHIPYHHGELPPFSNIDELFQALDMLFYLPGDILTKVDRATMAYGLEGRNPFLDYRLLEFSWHIPRNFKNNNGTGKFILRQMLELYVPRKLFNRPKSGFAIPLAHLLRNDLKKWADPFMTPEALARSGLLDEKATSDLWQRFQKGQQGHHHALWSVLMFQTFYEKHMA